MNLKVPIIIIIIIICYGTDELAKRSELKSRTLVIISFILILEVELFDP